MSKVSPPSGEPQSSPALTLTALSPPYAHGGPLAHGALRTELEDFIVEEELGFVPAGSGQHALLKVCKRGANTQWVARQLAGACGCRPLDVGYAGLKDRRAVAVQWFSVPQTPRPLDSWKEVRGEGFEVLEAHAHSRKLPRGALAGNRFSVRIRGMQVDEALLERRFADIRARGVPNYFGPQRFGRNGSNLERMTHDPRALKPFERGFVLSAARSLIFNCLTAERVLDGSWGRLEVGDLANLDDRGSVFPLDAVDPGSVERCERLEIHPTGPMWGRGLPGSHSRIYALETQVAGRFPQACSLLEQAGMRQERRALRLTVRNLAWQRNGAGLVIAFRLPRGSFATTVLREIVDSSPDHEAEG